MPLSKISFQTSEFTPPPFAHKIELTYELKENSVEISFQISYLERDEIEDEDIFSEGFSLEDDFKWQGKFPNLWKKEFEYFENNFVTISTKNLGSKIDIAILEKGDNNTINIDAEETLSFLEKCKQAIFEFEKFEAPMHIELVRLIEHRSESIVIEASFYELIASVSYNEKLKESISWKKLDHILLTIFQGEFFYEKASIKSPKKRGIFINLGNEWWFEVGKSVIITPQVLEGLFQKN